MSPDEILAALQACWCEQLAGTADGSPAQCCWVVGKPVIADCCAGFAWVRLVSAHPTTAFPRQSSEPQRCPAYTWALTVEVGVTRCAAAPCDETGQTCCDSEEAVAAAIFSDFEAARRLFSCGCLGLAPDQVIPGTIRTYGPEGGCVGITATAILQANA